MKVSWIDRALANTCALFEPRTTPAPRRRWEWWVLMALVMAGALLRLWGLGSVGLHREDEDTTAIAAMHILVDGTPRFPSGMFYGRAVIHSYLIAGSVHLFGATEWALRLPSVICGTLLMLLSYPLARRFLASPWHLVLVAVIALLPDLILMSQTARMYIFLVTSVVGFTVLILRWERTGMVRDLLAALAVFILSLQFHELAAFAAPLFLFPAITTADSRRLWQGVAAAAVGAIAYFGLSSWANSFYPATQTSDADSWLRAIASTTQLAPLPAFRVTLACTLIGAGLVFLMIRNSWSRRATAVCGALLALAIACATFGHLHLAGLLVLASAVLAYRDGAPLSTALWLPLAALLSIAALRLLDLAGSGAGLLDILASLSGLPSVWAYIELSRFSPIAGVLGVLAACASLVTLARRRPINDVWLYFVLAGWIPVLAVGLFKWHPPMRYTVVSLLPLLIVGTAAAHQLLAWLGKGLATKRIATQGTTVAAACVMLIQPVKLAQSVDARYEVHPDHLGAAEYIRSLSLRSNDILIAEDVIVQTYYLGKIDYWLIGERAGGDFIRDIDGVRRDIYTSSRVITIAEQLEEVISTPGRGDIYIIGSGELQSDGRLSQQGSSLHALMRRAAWEVAYQGRDGLTKVWKIPVRQSPLQ